VHELIQRRRQPDDAHQYERRHARLQVAQGHSGRGQTADRIRISSGHHTFRLAFYCLLMPDVIINLSTPHKGVHRTCIHTEPLQSIPAYIR